MRSFLAALLAITLTGCAPAPPAPSFAIAPVGASLVVRVTGDYRVQYLRPGAWDVAEATLTAPGGAARTSRAEAVHDAATGRRTAEVAFQGLAPGPGYRLAIALLRREGEATRPVGQADVADVTIATGGNALAVSPGAISQLPEDAPPRALSGFVSSLPGTGMSARMNAPGGVAVAPDGMVYVADTENGSIRRVSTDAQGRLTMTHLAGIGYAGFVDGEGAGARFNRPAGLTVGPDGAVVVADTSNRKIRRIELGADGRVTVSTLRTAAGGYLAVNLPTCVAVEAGGTYVVGEPTRLVRLSPSGAGFALEPLAGDASAGFADGAGTAARFGAIADLALGPDGTIYVADAGNGRVRVVSPAGAVSSLSGSYPSVSALAYAQGRLYMAEPTRFSRLDLASGVATAVAGSDWPGFANGLGPTAAFMSLAGLAVAPSGAIYLADAGDHRLRRAEPQPDGGVLVGTVAGDGEAGNMNGPAVDSPLIRRATAVAVDAAGGVLVADALGHMVVRLRPGALGDYDYDVLAGTGSSGATDGPGAQARFNGPAGVAVAPSGAIYVTDTGNGKLRRIVIAEDGAVTVSTVVSGLEFPGGVAVADERTLYVTEAGHPLFPSFGKHRVLRIALDEAGLGTATAIAGNGQGYAEGAGSAARFNRPTALACAPDGRIFVADAENHRVRVLAPNEDGSYTASTFAGTGVAGTTSGAVDVARFNRPSGLALDAEGRLYVADYWSHRVAVIAEGTMRTVAGGLGDGFADGPLNQALFSRVAGVAVAPDGMLYVVDAHPHGVRRVAP